MARLTELQRLVLAELAFVPRDDAPPTPSELAERIAPERGIRSWERKPAAEAESIANCLSRMARPSKRWVERRGLSSTGARCWAITDAGRRLAHEA